MGPPSSRAQAAPTSSLSIVTNLLPRTQERGAGLKNLKDVEQDKLRKARENAEERSCPQGGIQGQPHNPSSHHAPPVPPAAPAPERAKDAEYKLALAAQIEEKKRRRLEEAEALRAQRERDDLVLQRQLQQLQQAYRDDLALREAKEAAAAAGKRGRKGALPRTPPPTIDADGAAELSGATTRIGDSDSPDLKPGPGARAAGENEPAQRAIHSGPRGGHGSAATGAIGPTGRDSDEDRPNGPPVHQQQHPSQQNQEHLQLERRRQPPEPEPRSEPPGDRLRGSMGGWDWARDSDGAPALASASVLVQVDTDFALGTKGALQWQSAPDGANGADDQTIMGVGYHIGHLSHRSCDSDYVPVGAAAASGQIDRDCRRAGKPGGGIGAGEGGQDRDRRSRARPQDEPNTSRPRPGPGLTRPGPGLTRSGPGGDWVPRNKMPLSKALAAAAAAAAASAAATAANMTRTGGGGVTPSRVRARLGPGLGPNHPPNLNLVKTVPAHWPHPSRPAGGGGAAARAAGPGSDVRKNGPGSGHVRSGGSAGAAGPPGPGRRVTVAGGSRGEDSDDLSSNLTRDRDRASEMRLQGQVSGVMREVRLARRAVDLLQRSLDSESIFLPPTCDLAACFAHSNLAGTAGVLSS